MLDSIYCRRYLLELLYARVAAVIAFLSLEFAWGEASQDGDSRSRAEIIAGMLSPLRFTYLRTAVYRLPSPKRG